MIAIRSITLSNFRNYKNATVDFERNNGVIFIYGDNGAGKSTILNAINWCLYGDIGFHSITMSNSPKPKWGDENTVTEVNAVISVDDEKYSFKRTASGSNDYGVLTARLLEEDGNSKEVTPYQIEAIIKKILPENIKNLFFLSENFSTDIFSHSSAHSLKNNIYKISELDTVKKAITHLDLTESDYIKNIDKSSKDYDRIQEYQSDIEHDRALIKENEESINKAEDKIAQHRDALNKLKEKLSSIKQTQQLFRRRDLLRADLNDIDDSILNAKLDINDSVQNNYHKVLLVDGLVEYRNALTEAEADGLIPAKVDPKIMIAIKKTRVCSCCGSKIGEEQLDYIEEQQKKYENINRLKPLYGGKYQFSDIENQVNDEYYLLQDKLETINKEESKRSVKQEQYDDVCEELNGVSNADLPDNPEQACREHDKSIVKWQDRRTEYGRNIRELRADIAKKESSIRKMIGVNVDDTGEMERQLGRVRTLKSELEALLLKAEEVIRTRIENGVWETFSKILPSTQFTKVVIDENYSFGLITTQAYKADDSVLSVGEAKTLALSLITTLSKDIGYSDSPLFIDNLFNGIDASHYDDVTKCIEALSEEKQIFITYLYKENGVSGVRASSYFKSDTIAQELKAIKNKDTNDLCVLISQEK